MIDPTRRCDDMELIHPYARAQFYQLRKQLETGFHEAKTKTLFLPFETYRYPQRQKLLFEIEKTTKAPPFKSAHQFGMAVDFVPWTRSQWSWADDNDWDFLKAEAEKLGLERPIKWDLAHVQHPRWHWITDAVRY